MQSAEDKDEKEYQDSEKVKTTKEIGEEMAMTGQFFPTI